MATDNGDTRRRDDGAPAQCRYESLVWTPGQLSHVVLVDSVGNHDGAPYDWQDANSRKRRKECERATLQRANRRRIRDRTHLSAEHPSLVIPTDRDYVMPDQEVAAFVYGFWSVDDVAH
jgi:hypothetical protein